MIDFRDRESFAPNMVILASVVALVGGLVLQLMPVPKDPTLYSRTRKDTFKALEDKKKLEGQLETTQQSIQSLSWAGLTQDVNSSILMRLNGLIKKYGLKLGSIRPQRASTVDALNTIPYLVIVEGSFPNVLSFTRELQKPTNKLALSNIQYASADTNSDKVTGTLTVMAYLNPTPPPAPDVKKEDADKAEKKEEKPNRA